MKKKPSQNKSKANLKKVDAKSSKAKSKNSITRKNKRKKLSPWLFFLLLIPIALAFFLIKHHINKNAPDVPNEITAIQNSGALPTELSVSEAHALYTDGAFILDVRESDEWHQGHIPGATLIPLENLIYAYQSLPVSEPIIVVCRSGNRSALARDFLIKVGFPQVANMAGGMNSWIAAGYDLTTGD